MATIQPIAQPAFWRVTRGDEKLDGITHLGELTGVAPDASEIHAEGETAFVTALAPAAATLPELPDSGWLEAGAVYQHDGGVVMVRQSHYRTEHDPASTIALFWTVNSTDAWIAGEWVAVGVVRTYGGKRWRCVQAHTTQADWTPPLTPALWREYVETPPTAEWAVGVAYKVGDEVTYQGALYRCRQAHTSIVTWTPPAVLALWLPI